MSLASRRHQRFFAELTRRKVFRSAAIYGAGAFGLLQGVDVAVHADRGVTECLELREISGRVDAAGATPSRP